MHNQLSGKIPSWIGNLTQLVTLVLNDNKIHGLVPESISRLQNLQYLDLARNLLSGTLKLELVLTSKYLLWLQLTDSSLSLVYNHNATVTLPKLEFLGLAACNLSGEFPHFLRGQNNLGYLQLADNKIEGRIPQWFMNLGTQTFWHLSLGGNLLTGFEQLFDALPWNNLRYLNLSSNKFQGPLPIPPSSVFNYDVSNNKLTGEIPPAICNLTCLLALDVSNNNLNGTLPQCLGSLGNSASVLDLRNNSFSGEIPHTFSSRCTLRAVDFSENQFEGKIPRSLANCTKLEVLNLEENKIDDIFPYWLGVLPDLRILILRSNGLHGKMDNPKTRNEFPKLQIIDLSNNGLRGKLPLEYFRNWNSMKKVRKEPDLEYMQANTSFAIWGNQFYNEYDYKISMTNKGVMMLYEKIQEFLVAVDLSYNSFEGGLPEVIGELKELNFLNLSNNLLSGSIPPSFGNLKALESLDLSQNKLTGEIPQQLSQLTFLEFFNVSHNFLSGPIPRGNQFDTFDNSSFVANSGLCGKPLSKNCGNIEDSLPKPSASEGPGPFFEFGWKAVVIGYAGGLVIGVILGCITNTRKYELFVQSQLFARQQRKARRAKTRLSRS